MTDFEHYLSCLKSAEEKVKSAEISLRKEIETRDWFRDQLQKRCGHHETEDIQNSIEPLTVCKTCWKVL